MGLAAPKNRSRISNDPQNTTWANNTTRFGHKILTSQGWTPGSTLGATEASHASHFTAASSSHIRVLLKDDNLGLGAKRGSEKAENFGLAGLDSVLSRLNGNVKVESKEEKEWKEEVDRRGYLARRYGFMNFVSGGYLVGDKIEKGTFHVKKEGRGIKVEQKEVKIKVESEDESAVEQKKEKKKKRKRDRVEEEVKEETSEDQPKLKRKKKSMNLRDEAKAQDSETLFKSKSKRDRKERKKEKSKTSGFLPSESSTLAAASEPISDKAKRKAEKRASKEEKKLKKALKKAAKEAAKSNPTSAPDSESSSSEDESETPASSSLPTTGTSTPTLRGHHAVRQRYIMQKKRASMDPQALKEIFMIKTPA